MLGRLPLPPKLCWLYYLHDRHGAITCTEDHASFYRCTRTRESDLLALVVARLVLLGRLPLPPKLCLLS